MTFADLGIPNNLIKGLNELNIVTPTEIQELAIPFLLEHGTDLVGQAQTGTGKTAAYGLPLLERIDPKSEQVQALVLAPTRELGQQIAKQLFKFTKYYHKIFAEAVYGGAHIDQQIRALDRPTQIVVATPGRLIDLLEREAVNLDSVRTIVLDEADEMLSLGFKKELNAILRQTSGNASTWLFSATMPPDIKAMIHNYMSADAHRIEVEEGNVINRNIEHQYIALDVHDKLNTIVRFLKQHAQERGMIFCRTKAGAQTLAKQLASKNFSVDAIHGDLLQKERNKVMRAFKAERLQILIATDVVARGIDVADLAYVIHHQLPEQFEYYTHRSGRTARAGKSGISLAFVVGQELNRMHAIEKKLNISFREVRY